MSFIVKAIYQHGVFMPIESVTGLPENETVELQVMPVVPTPVDDAPALDWWAASESALISACTMRPYSSASINCDS